VAQLIAVTLIAGSASVFFNSAYQVLLPGVVDSVDPKWFRVVPAGRCPLSSVPRWSASDSVTSQSTCLRGSQRTTAAVTGRTD